MKTDYFLLWPLCNSDLHISTLARNIGIVGIISLWNNTFKPKKTTISSTFVTDKGVKDAVWIGHCHLCMGGQWNLLESMKHEYKHR